jgi:uncharacterized protein YndB with AHSA1/START domain
MTSEIGVVEREIFIAAPAETVFRHLTDARLMARWLGSSAQLDPRPHGIFQVEVSPGNVAHGEYVEVVPFRRVVFTWGWVSPEPELAALRPGASVVEIVLEPQDGGTRLRLRHSRLPDNLRPVHGERWSAHLGCLVSRFRSSQELAATSERTSESKGH